jgi:hypothetical protein
VNANEAYSVVLEYLIEESKNIEFIEKIKDILNGIKGKNHIEEESHPRFRSIVIFGHNIFPLRESDYFDMARLILANKRTIL